MRNTERRKGEKAEGEHLLKDKTMLLSFIKASNSIGRAVRRLFLESEEDEQNFHSIDRKSTRLNSSHL